MVVVGEEKLDEEEKERMMTRNVPKTKLFPTPHMYMTAGGQRRAPILLKSDIETWSKHERMTLFAENFSFLLSRLSRLLPPSPR